VALIVDTGPLYALLDRSDNYHGACLRLLETFPETLIVPSPVLVEVDWLLQGRDRGRAFAALLDDLLRGRFQMVDLAFEDYRRVRELMERYADADIGFVDASVLTLVERLDEPKLATLDRRHFAMMRPRHVEALRLLPD
jgi:predicted nucleic acid-binding protein